jgi:hypothetical protein
METFVTLKAIITKLTIESSVIEMAEGSITNSLVIGVTYIKL